ncbi:hypothetical protein F4560_001798 [Saccharothrix ecbatanensis]|uniref:DUF3558 domain-containing protein n=1 Tax=Saccharothrix ecbatanensis TaxID=1105145 RepID=A0A7W9LZM0_9PSEU|nr:DUF3558 family protein [Saccharothrix ecbatanensis]MBB5802030.1 hypothetical protein [Saccharothrix ecbatanensis]
MKPWIHQLGAVLGVSVLLLAGGCGKTVTGSAIPESPSGSETADSTGKEQKTGFDECGLAEPAELAKAIGVNAMYVTGRSAMTQPDGSRRASCTYFPEDVPGMLGLQISTVADTDAERFFAPFAKKFRNIKQVPKLGDRAEAVAYKANGTSTHYIEVRTISGDRGVHLYYTYMDSGGAMPKADGSAAALILVKALERLPDKVTIPDGTPDGRCADIDLKAATKALGAEFVMARSVVSEKDSMNCYFSGGAASFDVTLVTDPNPVRGWTVAPDKITHPDLGDGARLLFTEAKTLSARINVGDRVLAINASYDAPDTVTALRPADVELVRTIVDSVGKRK